MRLTRLLLLFDQLYPIDTHFTQRSCIIEQLCNVKTSQDCRAETHDQANSYEMNVYSLIIERVRLMHPSFLPHVISGFELDR